MQTMFRSEHVFIKQLFTSLALLFNLSLRGVKVKLKCYSYQISVKVQSL